MSNSIGFEHFKLHSDSTLKSLTKDELIEYVHLLFKNWTRCDENAERIIQVNFKLSEENELLKREVKALDEEGVMKCELNEKLSKALDKMINEHLKYDNDCPFMNDEKHNCDGLCGNKCWKEWCLKDVE